MAKERIADLPVMIQSSEEGVRERAFALGAAFADKGSESLEHELASFLQDSLGFGPFMFRMPDGAPVAEARDIDEFMGLLEEVPEECLVFHAGRNDFSTWLTARGELRFAERLKPYRIGDFGTTGAMRDFILGVLREARAETGARRHPLLRQRLLPGRELPLQARRRLGRRQGQRASSSSRASSTT